MSRPRSARALRTFWLLLVVAVLAAGSLSAALAAEPSPLVGMRVIGSGVVLVLSVALAGRVLVALDRARRIPGATSVSTGGNKARRAVSKRSTP